MLQKLQQAKHYFAEYKNDEDYFLQLGTLFMQKLWDSLFALFVCTREWSFKCLYLIIMQIINNQLLC